MTQITAKPSTICIFCGSSPGSHPGFVALAESAGKEIAARGHDMVYGGGGTGLMGASAKAVHEGGGHVLGVIPDFLISAERAYTDVETKVVSNMHERKMLMYEKSDAFIILPGGIGTLEEVTEMMSWKRLQLHQKPIVFLCDDGYWDPFIGLIKHTIKSRFSPKWMMDDIFSATYAGQALDLIEADWKRPKRALRPLAPVSKV
jgi:uncharacterized protein (TIGR00730 family)